MLVSWNSSVLDTDLRSSLILVVEVQIKTSGPSSFFEMFRCAQSTPLRNSWPYKRLMKTHWLPLMRRLNPAISEGIPLFLSHFLAVCPTMIALPDAERLGDVLPRVRCRSVRQSRVLLAKDGWEKETMDSDPNKKLRNS